MFISNRLCIFDNRKMNELLPHWSIGKLINYIFIPRLVLGINGGPQPSGFCLSEQRITKIPGHSNPVIRSFDYSTDAASYKADLQAIISICNLLFSVNINMTLVKKYWELFLVFFKIGAFTFGGGYAMIPLIKNEVVGKRNWLNDDEFIDMLAIAQSMPGPISLNTAIFVGSKRLGFRGSLVSGLGIILPSFVVILLIAIVFIQFKNNPVVERIFKGIRPAVVALIAAPLFSLGKAARISLKTIWIPIVVALSVWLLGVSPIYIVIASILLGIAYFLYIKNKTKL